MFHCDISIRLQVNLFITNVNLFSTGETAVFRCRIDGEPKPKIEWSKGKWRKLTNDAKTRIYYDEATGQHVMEIDNIKEKDGATYTVTISNEHGENTCSVTLIVTDKPEEAQDWKAQLKKTYVHVVIMNSSFSRIM